MNKKDWIQLKNRIIKVFVKNPGKLKTVRFNAKGLGVTSTPVRSNNVIVGDFNMSSLEPCEFCAGYGSHKKSGVEICNCCGSAL